MPAMDNCVLLVLEIFDRCEVAIVVILLLLRGGTGVTALACGLVVFFCTGLP